MSHSKLKQRVVDLVVVLGDQRHEIHLPRGRAAISVSKAMQQQRKNVFLLAKWYDNPRLPNNWTKDQWKGELRRNGLNPQILQEGVSARGFFGKKHSFDTVHEALGVRFFVQEQLARPAAAESLVQIQITVITTECHAARSKWIFEHVFEDLQAHATVAIQHVETTQLELQRNEKGRNRLDIEPSTLQRLQKNVGNSIYEYVNRLHNSDPVKHHFKFEGEGASQRTLVLEEPAPAHQLHLQPLSAYTPATVTSAATPPTAPPTAPPAAPPATPLT